MPTYNVNGLQPRANPYRVYNFGCRVVNLKGILLETALHFKKVSDCCCYGCMWNFRDSVIRVLRNVDEYLVDEYPILVERLHGEITMFLNELDDAKRTSCIHRTESSEFDAIFNRKINELVSYVERFRTEFDKMYNNRT